MEKEIKKLTADYLAALQFGLADLVACHDPRCAPSDYFAAIVRHEKLTAAIRNGLEAAKLIQQP